MSSSNPPMAEHPTINRVCVQFQSPTGQVIYEACKNRFPESINAYLTGVIARLNELNYPFEQHEDGTDLRIVATVADTGAAPTTEQARYVVSGSRQSFSRRDAEARDAQAGERGDM